MKRLFHLQDASRHPDMGYLISFSENHFSWGSEKDAMKMTRKQINEFKKLYKDNGAIFSVECD